jgi:hypothetical protein
VRLIVSQQVYAFISSRARDAPQKKLSMISSILDCEISVGEIYREVTKSPK